MHLGQDVYFINKEFRTEHNELLIKKQRHISESLRRKCIKNHLNKITEKVITSNKDFGTLLHLF